MASTYSPLLRIELIGTGDQPGLWGNTTNNNLGTLIEQAVAGTATVSVTLTDVTLSDLNGSSDQARCAALLITGSAGVTRNVVAPASSKLYVVSNTADAAIVLKTSTSTGLTIPSGKTQFAYYNGTDFIAVSQPYDADLKAIADLATTGIIVRTGAGSAATRSIAVSGTGLSVSNADGVVGNPTITSNATSSNVTSTIVARDGSGNFSAGTITATGFSGPLTGNVTGNASTATTLQTARNINGVSFNGSADITVTAVNPNTLTFGSYLTGTSYNGSSPVTIAVNATNANTGSTVVARDGSGNFSAGTITATLSGTATYASNPASGGSFITSSNIGSQSVNYANSAGSATYATYVNTSGGAQYFNWSGQGGQPTWLWGASAVGNAYLYNPSNFSVNYANSAGYASSAGSAPANGGTSSYVTINYSNNSNADYQILWGSGNGVYGTGNLIINPYYGNLTAGGNVTAYSDERLKMNWGAVKENFVEELATVKSGTYNRIDVEMRQAGVSAQSWQKLLPETVNTDDKGFLSVNYGAAALVAAVELAKKVVALEAKIAQITSGGE